MAIEPVFETHSTTVDNEEGRATGWLPGRLSARGRTQAQALGRRRTSSGSWSSGTSPPGGHGPLQIGGVGLEELADQDFAWQEGWEYQIN